MNPLLERLKTQVSEQPSNEESALTKELRAEIKRLNQEITDLKEKFPDDINEVYEENKRLRSENQQQKTQIFLLKEEEKTKKNKTRFTNPASKKYAKDGLEIVSIGRKYKTPESIKLDLDGKEITLGEVYNKRNLNVFLKFVSDMFGVPIAARDSQKRLLVKDSNDTKKKILKVLSSFERIPNNHQDLIHPELGRKRFPRCVYNYIISQTL
ncbi:hypothetical protein PLEI_1470 [Photobacterium leiognathi lrivu.4.1]|uniref:Uncharacterized protein n=1 Tax=Photobacterium leiognathi lrivu.4.1 TaxID=1248232 RepID=A0A0U1P577_PHOLE|nr:hypothetical protein [Photobacterium leiognathi]GAD29817.1 hypothetical protein PLEI_1470 [Photobacterium leiognathi lrivu.4.1]